MRDYQALGDAVTERRNELALSLRDAAALSRRIDTEINGHPTKVPGIGDTTWMRIGQGAENERYAHTLHLVDQTLRWPSGTAAALLDGEDLPDSPVADGPCACAVRANGAGGSVGALLSPPAVAEVEADNRRDEVTLLRHEVLRLIDRVETIEQAINRALQSSDDGM